MDELDRVKETIAQTEREEWLTVQEYADRSRLHVQTVYSAIRQNRLPFRVVRTTGARGLRIIIPRET